MPYLYTLLVRGLSLPTNLFFFASKVCRLRVGTRGNCHRGKRFATRSGVSFFSQLQTRVAGLDRELIAPTAHMR